MNIGNINLGNAANSAKLFAMRNWPTIATVAGCVGIPVGTYLACRATNRHYDTIMEDHRNALSMVNDDLYAEESTAKREKARIFASTGSRLVKAYAPAAVVQVASIALIGSAHAEMSSRQTAISAAYATAMSAFEAYRQRVRDQIGNEQEFKIMYDLDDMEIAKTEVDEETGKKKKVKEHVLTLDVDPSDYTRYARCFCKWEPTPDGQSNMGSHEWTNDSATNLFFLKEQEAWANDKLHAHGWLCLNEVYDMLGFDRILEGQVVGWFDNPEHDKVIDFGIYDVTKRPNQLAVNQPAGYAPAIMLDFNVDPVTLYDKEASFRS